MARHLHLPLALLAALCAGTAAPAQAPLTIEYRDRPPYSHTEAGKPAGFLMERTARLLKRAGSDWKVMRLIASRDDPDEDPGTDD